MPVMYNMWALCSQWVTSGTGCLRGVDCGFSPSPASVHAVDLN